ncbi:MAG: phosphotransferase [Actinobacteria bacterium]|nr:phosphotransferase [Actinomycetota bacterium]
MDELPDQGRLRRRAEEVAAEWGLELGPPFALSRFSYVAPVGDDAVLKIADDGDDECLHEPDSLRVWNGRGAVRLLRSDPARRALLQERARPGSDLSELPEARAVGIAVEVGAKLWVPAGEPFRWIGAHVPRWLDDGERDADEGSELIPLARELYAELDVGRATLIHGDFHHHNILRHGERYVAIDSKAMLGDPEYDIPSFLRNPLSYRLVNKRLTEQRIRAFVDVGLDDFKIRAWAVIRLSYLGADPEESALVRSLL